MRTRLTMPLFSLFSCAAPLWIAGCCDIGSIATTSLPDATMGQGYSVTLEHNCSGEGHLQQSEDWRITEGSTLPPGLALAGSSGVISGTPTVSGTYQLGIQLGVSDISTFTVKDSRTFTLLVQSPSAMHRADNASPNSASNKVDLCG